MNVLDIDIDAFLDPRPRRARRTIACPQPNTIRGPLATSRISLLIAAIFTIHCLAIL